MLDQPYSWSWTSDSSSHQFGICLYLLHCSALSTGCSIYTSFCPLISPLSCVWLTDMPRPVFLPPATLHPWHVQMGSGLSVTKSDKCNHRTPAVSLWWKRVQLLYLSLVQSRFLTLWSARTSLSHCGSGRAKELKLSYECFWPRYAQLTHAWSPTKSLAKAQGFLWSQGLLVGPQEQNLTFALFWASQTLQYQILSIKSSNSCKA